MEVVDEPREPLHMTGSDFMEAAGVHTVQIRNFEQLADERAAYVTALLQGRSLDAATPPSQRWATGYGAIGDALLDQLTDLRVDRQLGPPASYQQLVLLWAISGALQGRDRLQAYSTVWNELAELLAPFAVGRTAPDPAVPWYALRTTRWWRLIGVPDGAEGAVERGRDLVRRLDPAGGLTQDAHRLVTSNDRFRDEAIRRLEAAIAGHPAATATMGALFGEAPPDTSPFEEALRLLLDLRGREITTTTGAVNRVLAVQPPNVLVGTDRSPQGQPVPIADVHQGLEMLELHGAVTIDVETLGHRSSFVGAVLATRSGVTVTGSPPVVSSTDLDVRPVPWDPDPVFAGDTSGQATVPTRREQGRLRATLFKTERTKACALCGDEFPVAFLRAAHIKQRSECSEDERRQLFNIAMPACVFGCDALYEAGFVAVDEDGFVRLSEELRGDATLSRRASDLEGRRCTAHTASSAAFFAWHFSERFRGAAPRA